MSRKELTETERNFKAWLLSGHSITKIARNLKMSKTTAYRIVDNLIYYGEVVELFHDEKGEKKPYNPRLFEDPNASRIYDSPKESQSAESTGYGGVMQTHDPLGNRVPRLNMVGVSDAPECPEGFCEGHVAGQISFTLKKAGTENTIRGPDGLTYGFLSSEVKNNGTAGKQRSGEIRLFNQKMGITYRWFPSGKAMFLLYPQRLYFDPILFTCVEEVRELFMERAQFVAYLLGLNGWEVTDPVIQGPIHYAWEQHELCKHFNKDEYIENADMIVDSSKGVPELELTHSDDPLYQAKAKVVAQFPTRILDLESQADLQAAKLENQEREMQYLRHQVSELTELLSGLLEENKLLTEITTQLTKSTANLSTATVRIGSNLSNSVQRQIDSYVTNVDPKVPALENFVKTNDDKNLEGYQ